MFVARKQDATSEAQSGAFYASQSPISQLVPPGKGIAETTQKLSFGPKKVYWACSLRKQDATSEAQSDAFYAPQNPISQLVPPGNGTARNHPET
jgi:hypothetical protein